MRGSWRIGRLAGIGIYVHWTFAILVLWILGTYLLRGQGILAAAVGLAFVLMIFACVVLHELGHALTARHYGVQTRDITLLPIGGLARLQRMPDRPLQELAVALAGPAVNVVIALVLLALLLPLAGVQNLMPQLNVAGDGNATVAGFFVNLMWANAILVAFNLLPAFPMDGGRALRALLATRLNYTQATNIAATVGQVMALLFGAAGLLSQNFVLIFIAIFVYLGAEGESHMARIRAILQGVPVRDAMITRFQTLRPDDTLEAAVTQLLAGSQRNFPVVEEGRLRGVLLSDDLVKHLNDGEREVHVSEIMRANCPTVDEREMMDRVLERMNDGSCSTLPVLRDDRLIGMISMDTISRFMMIRSALQHPPASQDANHISRAA